MCEESPPRVVVVGGGPAGLFAAETAAAGGARVSLYEAKASVGRKLLVAGRGGLNLTHGDEFDLFVSRYRGSDTPQDWWSNCLTEFTPAMLREWAAELGIETFEQRTGRVYPREMKAAPLLRRWVERLRAQTALPAYALGGVGPEDLGEARRHGAQGVAGIRAFWSPSE
jgi:predicted flavoprotein YhiN